MKLRHLFDNDSDFRNQIQDFNLQFLFPNGPVAVQEVWCTISYHVHETYNTSNKTMCSELKTKYIYLNNSPGVDYFHPGQRSNPFH